MEQAFEIIERFEAEGRDKFQLQPGAHDVLQFFDSHNIPKVDNLFLGHTLCLLDTVLTRPFHFTLNKALFTRNSQRAIEFLQEKSGFRFDVALSRDFAPVKPAPDGALHIARNVFKYAFIPT